MSDTKKVVKKRPRSESGEALLEIALVLPILLLLSLGMLDFGRAFFAKNIVDTAAREAARVAAVSDVDIALAEARGNYILSQGNLTGANTVVAPMAPDKTVTATATYRFTFITPGLFALFSKGLNDPSGLNMTGKCVMRVEGK